MKSLRVLFCCVFAVALMSVSAEDVVLKQFQTFKWKPVARAKKYEVAVQQKNADGSWVAAESQQTKDTRVEMLLLPGDYRVSISAFNVLGKKASSSPWIGFVILNETEPYLSPDIFAKDSSLGDFVLRRTATIAAAQNTGTETGTEQAAEPETEEAAETESNPNAGTLTVTGRNFFFPDTTFSLIPIDNDDFPSLMDKRDTVDLPVIVRDREQNQLEVAVDWTKLFAGYYTFEVKNPGGETDSCTVCILPERGITFVEKTFDYNRRYKVRTCTVQRQELPVQLTVRGTDFQSNTAFTLEPSTGIPYPFASTKERGTAALKVVSSTCRDKDSGECDMVLELDTRAIETGYYRLTAQTPGLEESTLNLLVEVELPPELKPEVKKIKTKLDKSDKSVAFVMEGQRLSFSISGESLADGSSAVLVAPCDENGVNARIPLMLSEAKKNGKKITFEADSDMLAGGTYALMIETPAGTQVTYVELAGGTFAAKMMKMTEEQVEEKFLRSETLDDPEPVVQSVPAPVAGTPEFSAAANAAAFLDGTKWKQTGGAVRLFCYEKEVAGQKRLAMRFPGTTDNGWRVFENSSEDAVRLLQAGTALRLTVVNDSDSPRSFAVQMPIVPKRRLLTNDGSRLSYWVTVTPQSIQTFVIPYRDCDNNEGMTSGVYAGGEAAFNAWVNNDVACAFNASRIKSLQIVVSSQGRQRLEITELSVINDTLPSGSQPFYNTHWVGYKASEHISLENVNGRFGLRMTSPGTSLSVPSSNAHYVALFANYSTATAQELCGAEGLSFSVSADRKVEWSAVFAVAGEFGDSLYFEKKFTVLPDIVQTVTIPYSDFGSNFDASRITGLQFKRYEFGPSNSGKAVFTSNIVITELTAYGNGKTMMDDTYVPLDSLPAAVPYTQSYGGKPLPGFDSTDGWKASSWDNTAKTTSPAVQTAEMQDSKLLFTATDVSYDWNTHGFTLLDNAEANAVLATADGIQFDALYTGKNLESAGWRINILQKQEDGTLVYFQKHLSLKRNKTIHVVLPYKEFEDAYTNGPWTKTKAYPFDRSKICGIAIVAQRRDGSQNPLSATFSTQLAISNARTYDAATDPANAELEYPVFFTALTLSAGATPNHFANGEIGQYYYGFELRWLDFQWFSSDFGFGYDILKSFWNTECTVRFAIPLRGFKPYAGGGIGFKTANIGDINQGILTVPLFAGVTLFEHLDLRYNCNYNTSTADHDADFDFFENSFSVGILFKLRKPRPAAAVSGGAL